MSNEPRLPGPCVVCGATDYFLSMGGPTICPSCDTGASSDPRRFQALRVENRNLMDELFAAKAKNRDEESWWKEQHDYKARAEAAELCQERLATELALAKEANAQRAAKFQAQQKKLVTLIRQLHAEVREYRAKKVLWEGELFTLRFYANDMATDLEAMRRGIDWAMLCAAPEEPALVMYRKYQREHP